jgi:DNA-binding NarL/FixJ family response regulator
MEEPHNSCIRVIVADPSPVVLSGFARFFESVAKISMVAGVSNLRHLQRKLQEDTPDVTIIDWGLVIRDTGGSPDVIRDVATKTKVLFAAMPDQTRERKQAFHLGAKGMISKQSSSTEVCKAINKIASGGIWIEKNCAEALLQMTFAQEQAAQPIGARIEKLTAREREIVDCVCKGLKSKAIASELHISETTVAHHLTSVFAKLQVQDRVGLVSFAYWHHLHVQQKPHPQTTRGVNRGYKIRPAPSFRTAVDRQECS